MSFLAWPLCFMPFFELRFSVTPSLFFISSYASHQIKVIKMFWARIAQHEICQKVPRFSVFLRILRFLPPIKLTASGGHSAISYTFGPVLELSIIDSSSTHNKKLHILQRGKLDHVIPKPYPADRPDITEIVLQVAENTSP